MATIPDLALLTLTLAVATLVLLVLYVEQLRDMRHAAREQKAETVTPMERARTPTLPVARDSRPSDAQPAPPLDSGPRTRIRGSVVVGDEGPDDPRMASDDTLESFRMPAQTTPLVSELAHDPDIADIVADFVNVLGARADALMRAFTREDTATLKRLVHQLKGSAGGYGFPTISEQARQVEAALERASDRAQLKQAIDGLCTLCFRACLGAVTERNPRAVA